MKRRMISVMLFVVMCMQLLATSAGAITLFSGEMTEATVATWEKYTKVNGYNYKVTEAADHTYYTWDRYLSDTTYRYTYSLHEEDKYTSYKGNFVDLTKTASYTQGASQGVIQGLLSDYTFYTYSGDTFKKVATPTSTGTYWVGDVTPARKLSYNQYNNILQINNLITSKGYYPRGGDLIHRGYNSEGEYYACHRDLYGIKTGYYDISGTLDLRVFEITSNDGTTFTANRYTTYLDTGSPRSTNLYSNSDGNFVYSTKFTVSVDDLFKAGAVYTNAVPGENMSYTKDRNCEKSSHSVSGNSAIISYESASIPAYSAIINRNCFILTPSNCLVYLNAGNNKLTRTSDYYHFSGTPKKDWAKYTEIAYDDGGTADTTKVVTSKSTPLTGGPHTFDNKNYYVRSVSTKVTASVVGAKSGTVTSGDINAYPTGKTYDEKTNYFYDRHKGSTTTKVDSGKFIRNECLSSSTTTGFKNGNEWWTFLNQGYGPGEYEGLVTSTNANAYPDNGASGNYWYVKVTSDDNVAPTLETEVTRSASGVYVYCEAVDKDSDAYVVANGVAYSSPCTLYSDSVETVSIYAQDVYGARSQTKSIAIDAVGPNIYVEYDPPNNGTLVNEVTATISAVDTSGLDTKPIKIGNGEWQDNEATYTFDHNSTVVAYAKDSLGNVSSFEMTVDWIDLEVPTIVKLTPDVEGFTNGNVKLKAEAKDDVGLDAKPYLWGTYHKDKPNAITWIGEYSASDTYTVTSNIGVALKVRDRAGKESEVYTYYVENIDRTAPIIDNYQTSVPLTSAINPSNGVTVTINAHDPSDSITNTSAGLVNDYVYWNGAWGGRSNTFYSPGTLVIKVRDAAGNISAPITVTIPSVDSDGPEITSFTGTHMGKAWTVAPVTLTVAARDTDGSALPKQCYSWDGGKTWTSLNTKKVTENGEYNVMVRDKVGNTVSDSIIVNNIDSEKPTANIYLARVHNNPLNPDSNLIWKVYVDVADQISGVDYVKTLWDGGTHADVFPIVQEVTTTGMYGVIVVDKAGNETYTYLTVTNEMLGNEAPSSGTNSEYVNTVLNPNIDGLGTEWSDPSNLVYGPDGMYNKSTGNYKSYSDVSALNGNKGVFLQVNLTSKSGTWTTGVAKLNGVDYPLTFDKFGGSMEISAEPTTGYVFIPISNIHQDVKNGRLKILISEWSDESKTENIRSGSLQIYVSVQKTQPIISYNYNRTTGKLTLNPVSTVAGIKEVLYSLDGSTPSVKYSAPFTVPTGSTIKIKATDKVNQITDLTLDSGSLSLNGSSGGMNSEVISGTYSLTSYSISTRTMDSYLINGSQSNTDQVPSSAVLDLFN